MFIACKILNAHSRSRGWRDLELLYPIEIKGISIFS